MLCMKCGHVSTDTARFCAQCGVALRAPDPAPGLASAVAAAPAEQPPPAAEPGVAPQPTEAGATGPGPSAAAPADGTTRAAELGGDMPPPAVDTAVPPTNGDSDADAQNKRFIWLFASIGALATAALAIWLHGLYRESAEITIALSPAHLHPPAHVHTPPPAPAARRVHVAQNAPPPPAAHTAPAVKRDAPAAGRRRQENAAVPAKETPPRQQVAAAAAPPPPRNPARSINQIFRERSASECEDGLSGLICREKLRFRLCDGHWAAQPPPGQSICHQPENNVLQ